LPVRAAEPDVTAKDLPRFPPVRAEDAAKTFKIRPGFGVELAAAEPQVVDPVAIAFDEDSRVWVVEMRDYSERRDERLGQIRLLEDADGDGRYEKMTVFAEGLAWPTAVFPWDGGVFVGCTPDILYMKDTDGDGKADVKKVVYTGFADTMTKLNVQGLLNSFNWGLDNRIHGTASLDGGHVHRMDPLRSDVLDVRGKGFAFNPRTLDIAVEDGGGQHGLSFDDWGRMYVCSNSNHIQTFAYDLKYAPANPRAAMPAPLVGIAVDGPAAEVYRASPEEPWRVIRTKWRVGGLVPGPIEGGGRSAGYFTGATGVTIYRGDAYGADFEGDAFIGDAGGHLVHRKKIRPDGILPKAERADDEQKSEFLASTDTWFRPVQFANGPDGCLYVIDMYREVIEHPWSLPDNIKKHLDLNSGNDMGRIWRVVPQNFQRRPPVRMSRLSTAELVQTLEHPNGWHRDTAARLLFTRQDKSAVAPLERMAAQSKSPLGRRHALYALDGLGALGEPQVLAALTDAAPKLRVHAIRLAEILVERGTTLSDQMRGRLEGLADDPDAEVRYQLALGVARLPIDRRSVLFRIARRDHADRWIRAAIIASAEDHADDLLKALIADPAVATADTGRELLRSLAASMPPGVIPAVSEDVAPTIEKLTNESSRYAIAAALLAAAAPATRQSVLAPLSNLVTAARAAAPARDKSEATRLAALDLLARIAEPNDANLLTALISPAETSALQSAAIAALDRVPGSDLPAILLPRWPQLAPRVRETALTILIKRPDRAAALLTAVEKGALKPSEIPPAQVAALRQSRDKSLRERVTRLFATAARRQDVVRRFTPALDLKGDPAKGHDLYLARCASCHRLKNEGHALGPDLETVKNMGREKILTNILDPNREVAPNYTAYVVETADGDQQVGLIANETPAAVTLKMAYGMEVVIARADIKSMRSAGLSMMPEGLEEGLTEEDFANLMDFILGAH
jgi:putative membrane-bound dehydrogenase-like protein